MFCKRKVRFYDFEMYFLQIVLSGFGTGEQHLKLTTIMFQNIFPAIDINTVSKIRA